MPHRETESAIRGLLLDVLDKCARHMEASPDLRHQFKPVAYAVHSALEDFERLFSQDKGKHDPDQDRMLFTRAQHLALEWLQTMQDLRLESGAPEDPRGWPTWTVGHGHAGHSGHWLSRPA